MAPIMSRENQSLIAVDSVFIQIAVVNKNCSEIEGLR